MQIKINKKSQYLTFKHKDGREEYEIDLLLNSNIGSLTLKDVFSKIKKYPGDVVIVPNMGYIFEDDKLVDEFTYFNGHLLKEQNKVAVLTQGNFSLGNLGFSTFGKNIDFINIYTTKLQIGILSPYLQLDMFKIEKMPDAIQDSNIIMANDIFAPILLSEEYPIYVFWGNSNNFVKNTGISDFSKKESISIKKVDKNSLSRTIYFLE